MAGPTKKAGAPTKYKEEYNESMISFFDTNPFDIIDGKLTPSKFPTLARFALNIGVHTDTLYEWAHGKDKTNKLKHPEFSVTYKKAKLYQEAFLYEAGLVGAIDRTFGIWATKTILGHKEPEREQTDKGEDIADALNNLADKLPS